MEYTQREPQHRSWADDGDALPAIAFTDTHGQAALGKHSARIASENGSHVNGTGPITPQRSSLHVQAATSLRPSTSSATSASSETSGLRRSVSSIFSVTLPHMPSRLPEATPLLSSSLPGVMVSPPQRRRAQGQASSGHHRHSRRQRWSSSDHRSNVQHARQPNRILSIQAGGSEESGDNGSSDGESGSDIALVQTDESPSWKHEAYAMFQLSWPVSVASLFRIAVYSTDSAFLGHLGTEELAASSLASTFMMVALMFVMGSAAALNTLCSQAYGAGNYELVGLWLQCSLFCSVLLAIPVIVLFLFVGDLVSLIEDNHRVVELARLYGQYTALLVLPISLWSILRQYFQSQGIVLPATIVSFFCIGVNIGFNQLLIYGVGSWKGFGFIGSPLATLFSMLFQVLAYYTYMVIFLKAHRKTWPGWTLEALKHGRVWTFLQMALPMALSLAVDEGVFQALILVSSQFGDTSVAAMGIMFQIWGITWAIWWGIGLATQVRVGHHLGGNRPNQAKQALSFGLLACVIVYGVLAAVMFGANHYLAMPFSNDPAVLDKFSSCMVYLVLSCACYGMGMTVGSACDGMGMPGISFAVASGAALCIMLPLAYVLGVVEGYELEGLWAGTDIGDSSRMVVFVFVTMCISWERAAQQAVERSEAHPKEMVEAETLGDKRTDSLVQPADLKDELTPLLSS